MDEVGGLCHDTLSNSNRFFKSIARQLSSFKDYSRAVNTRIAFCRRRLLLKATSNARSFDFNWCPFSFFA
jgi:hypothetical protein